MNVSLSKEKEAKLCPICLQTQTNCRYFRRLRFELLCFDLWLVVNALLQASRTKTLSLDEVFNWIPMIIALQIMERTSPAVPDDVQMDHVPAHWLKETESKVSHSPLPEPLDFSLIWQGQLNRHSEKALSITTPFLRLSWQIRLTDKRPPKRLLTPIRAKNRPHALGEAVLRELQGKKRVHDLPICSITLEIPKDPAYAIPCGHTFSRAAITEWVNQRPHGEGSCPNCRSTIQKIEPIFLPLPIDHRRLHESVYCLWISGVPETKPIPRFQSKKNDITRWLLRHSLFFSNPAVQGMIQQQSLKSSSN